MTVAMNLMNVANCTNDFEVYMIILQIKVIFVRVSKRLTFKFFEVIINIQR